MKKIFVCWMLGAFLLAGVSHRAAAAAPLVLKISHQFPANVDFRDRLVRKFAAEVEKETKGQIRFQIYPGASLYKPYQQFDAMANGALDMSVYPLAYSGGKLPATNLTLMPALIENYQQGYDWENADIGKWLEKYLDAHGVKIVTWLWQAGGVASRDKPILVPADLKGLKTRGAGKMIELMLQAAGAFDLDLPVHRNLQRDALGRGRCAVDIQRVADELPAAGSGQGCDHRPQVTVSGTCSSRC